MWDEFVQAYESRLSLLEEARAQYSKAVGDLIRHVGAAIEAEVRAALSEADDLRIEAAILDSGENAVLPSAPWVKVTIYDDFAGTEFRIGAWVASTWGGPNHTLRVALSLERVHDSLQVTEWINQCGALIESSAQGEPYDQLDWMKFADAGPDWQTIRIASVDLVDEELRCIASNAGEVAGAFASWLPPMSEIVREAALPMMRVEEALAAFRPSLEARAEKAGASVSPVRGTLGPWHGGKYLQVGSFWLATEPRRQRLVASCNKADRDVLSALAVRLGATPGPADSVVILSQDALRDPERDIHLAVAQSFEVWFEMKASELNAALAHESPESQVDDSSEVEG